MFFSVLASGNFPVISSYLRLNIYIDTTISLPFYDLLIIYISNTLFQEKSCISEKSAF